MTDEMAERTARLEGELAAARDLMAKAEQDVLNVRPDGETGRQRLWQADAEQALRQQMGFLGKLLEVLDNLHLSITYGQSSAVNVERLVEGVRLTCSLLQGSLAGEGVTEIPAVGEMFNPALHEALDSEVTNDFPDGQIVADLRRGYRYGGQLLRPSLVRVAIATTARERVPSATVAPAPTRAPGELIVDATGGGDYTTIASAYANAKAGESIVVRPGTYREALVLDRDVEIVGEGDRALIVVEATDTDAVTVTADRAAVRNLTVRAVGTGDTSGAVWVQRGRVVIEGCDLTSAIGSVVYITGRDSAPVIRDCAIRDGQSAGVVVQDQGQGMIEQCVISGNAYAGVEISTGGNPVVRDCAIRDGKSAGVLVHERGQGTFEQCVISGNTYAGVQISDGGNPMLRDCEIGDGQLFGVSVHEQGQGTIEQCVISGNSFAGVGIETGGNPMLRDCVIKGGLLGVSVGKEGLGNVSGCDLTGMTIPWQVDVGANVTRTGNRPNA